LESAAAAWKSVKKAPNTATRIKRSRFMTKEANNQHEHVKTKASPFVTFALSLIIPNIDGSYSDAGT
jgi:hypothetical protein